MKVLEPLTGPEVSKLEKAREGISSELAAFDKADLKETEVEEKVVLPGKEEIAQERGHLEHIASLGDGKFAPGVPLEERLDFQRH